MPLTSGALPGAADSRRFRAAALVGVLVIAIDAAVLSSGIGGAALTKAWTDLMHLPVIAASVLVCLWTARARPGRTRRAWILIAAAVASWGAGECVWAFYELVLHRNVPFPSPADFGFLLLIPLAAMGVLSLPTAPRALAARSRFLADALIIATSLFALSWNVVLGPVYRAGSGGALKQALGLGYPFGDLVLIGVVLFMGARGTRSDRRVLGFLGLGLASIAVSDSLFNYFVTYDKYSSTSSTNLLGIGWTVGWILIALGALRPVSQVRSRDDSAPSKFGAMLPYAAVVVGVPIEIVKFVQTGVFDPVVFAAGMALFAAVGARQLLFALENRALAHNLELKVAERTAELERTLEKLREAALRQEEFVSHASHELFTPLTTIVGTIDLLSEPGAVPVNEIPNIVEMARLGARHMTQLVDDLLLATGLTGFIACERIPFDVTEQVRAAVDGFEPFAKTIETRHVERVTALGDPERFRQALVHLLSNADKFAPSGTTIRVEQYVVEGNVCIVVSDEGPGIPVESREDVFERFQQLDRSDTRGHEGLGLGLFLARQLVRAMGGDITVDDVKRGCAIRIRLLRAGAKDSRRQPAAGVGGSV